MKITNSIKMTALSAIVSTLIVGCGGGSDDTSTVVIPPNSTPTVVNSVLTGTFVDVPVQGLAYKTLSQSGFTDAKGKFNYLAGEEIEFMLGDLSLGKGSADALVTPYTISDDNDTATNIALLLQNFDSDRTNNTLLDLSKLRDYNFTANDFNLSATTATIKAKIDTLFADNDFASYRDASNNSVIDATTVKSNMDAFITSNSIVYDKKFTQAYLGSHVFYSRVDGTPDLFETRFIDGKVQAVGGNNIVQTTYELKDGKLIQLYIGNGIRFKISYVITSISGTSITVLATVIESTGLTAETAVGSIKSEIIYTNKVAAKNAAKALFVQSGFSQSYLNNTVFYKSTTQYPQYINKYIDGKIYFAGDEGTQGWNTTFGTASSSTYSLNNGVINATFSTGENVTSKIIEVTDTYVKVLSKLVGSTLQREEIWYTSKAAAELE
ncbi:hypothetical protein JHD49_10285 [Sulfurimonas sp. SAG-AH-194-C21]|nr:hypothetical protein [Sulfurimonas sp. SAG-AH-194-C21]MDF1884330.1 hypothetical protein [Sulfurimonas sp. SAG-AH-194-C21]